MDDLVKVCKAIPGFCERSRKLSGPARRAIIGAFIQSGQELPIAAQRYIDHHGTIETFSNLDVRNACSHVTDHEASSSHPRFHEIDGTHDEDLRTTAIPTFSSSTGETQQVQYAHATDPTSENARTSCLSLQTGPENTALDTLAAAASTQSLSSHEAGPNAIANNQNIMSGQTSQRSLQPFDPSWPQEPAAHDTSYSGAMNPLLNEFSQVEMPNGDGTMEVCTFWDDATYYDRLM